MSGQTEHNKHERHRRLVSRLREQAEDVRRLTSGLTEDQMAERTAPDRWSLKELVCHLYRIQQVFTSRIETVLSEENPAIVSYEPEGDTEFGKVAVRPAAESLGNFLADRDRLTTRLERLTPAEWHRKGTHPEFPHYDIHFQVEYMAHHEAHHLYQIFQRRIPLGKMPH
jgi:hypothetical protein